MSADQPGSRTETAAAQPGAVSLLLAVAVLVGTLALGGVLAGAAVAQEENGTSPPELDGGEKVNTTAVELLFVDEEGVDAGSIDIDDFLLSDGELAHVSATAEGTGATATLVLAGPIDADELTVGIATGSDIQDVNGERIQPDDNPTVTISGMDGAAPSVLGTDVGDALGGPADIEFRFDEPLSALGVEITGPENVTLDIEDFENPRANRYVTEYEPPESGEYQVALVNATDEAGNTGNYSVVRSIEADRSAPEAVIGIDFGASSGTNVTFDASQSVGDRLSYTWEFGDGANASGERVSHEFEPTEHTVTLVVEDEFGNADEDRIDLNLTDGIDSGTKLTPENGGADPAVIVDRDSPTETRYSLVSVTGALAEESLEVGSVGDEEGPLLDHEAIRLDSIAITPTVNTSFSFALSALSPGDVGDSTAESVPLGGFTVLSDATGSEVETAAFTFGVDADVLDSHGLSPDDVELQREVDGEWVRLDTVVLNESGDSFQFRASTPGFSRFAVVGTDHEDASAGDDGETTTAEPSVAVTDATVDPTTVEPGDAVEVAATVENDGDADGTFRAELELDGMVADSRTVDVAAGDTETVQFTPTLEDSGTVVIGVSGTTAGEVTVRGSEGDERDTAGGFTVRNVTLERTSIEPGESVSVSGDVLNEGDEQGDFLAELEVDGEVVDTFEVPQVPPGEDIPVQFTEQFDEEGTYNVSISGNEAGSELEVSEDGLLSFLGFLPLGAIPFGLIRTAVTFVGIPLLVVFLLLKAVAFYLGY